MAKWNKCIEKVFKTKKGHRRELAELPVEEKLKIFLQLQKNVYSILKLRGCGKKPWMMGELFQVREGESLSPEQIMSVNIVVSGNWEKIFSYSNMTHIDARNFIDPKVSINFRNTQTGNELND